MSTKLFFISLLLCTQLLQAQVNNPGQVAQQGATDHANNDISNSVNNGLNKTEGAIKGLFKKKKTAATPASTSSSPTTTATATTAPGASAADADQGSLKTYANYDFIPGDAIIFEDDFTDDADGEFPAHWTLEKGQGIINKVGGVQAFFLTQGNYVRVGPRMKTPANYLPENFTIEFDFYPTQGSYSPTLLFDMPNDESRNISFGTEVETGYFTNNFSGAYPGDKEHFTGKWHHAAMIKKGNQLKCYVDQFRVLVIPDCGSCNVSKLNMGGIGSQESPIVFKNFRMASGGSMNMIGKKFTDAKIVTHGINFDVDKSTIKPESMGTLNKIVGILKDNPDIKFEIDGHTDNSGAAPHNLQL